MGISPLSASAVVNMAGWEGVVSQARRWAGRSALGFAVSSVEEGTRKISFRAPCGSFYVTVPENVGSDEWVRAGVIWNFFLSFLYVQENFLCSRATIYKDVNMKVLAHS